MGARVIAVEVLVNFKDQIGIGAVEVRDFREGCCGTRGDKGLGGCVVRARKEDDLGGCPSLSDGSYGGLNGLTPGVDVRHW